VRILFTTRGSSGHIGPLLPFAHACLRAGHEVMVAAQRQHRGNVDRAGLAFTPVDDPPKEEWMPLMAQFARLSVEAANERMVREFFAGIDTRAALPRLRSIVEDWQPDIIVRESWEFASTLVAELYDVPLARVGLGLAAVEELSIRLTAETVDRARAAIGLAPDPAGNRLRDAPYLTMVPEPLEDPAVAPPTTTHRFAHGRPAPAPPLTDWWPGNDDPLVYVTLGTVASAEHLPYFPALYRTVIDALAPLRARVLLTIGDGRDPHELGPIASNVHVERWVAQDAVLPHAAAVVCHGGYGSTLGALRHGVPLVVVPLFSSDQWANAAAVARAGAGLALDAEHTRRRVLELPSSDTTDALAPAVVRLLGDTSYRRSARRLADAADTLPSIDAAVDVLASISGRHATGRPVPVASGRRRVS
jgi:UDP:flavonoid glycosyltransferase YjiC (YdhE family)